MGQIITSTNAPHAVAPAWARLHPHAERSPDPFTRAVPDAGTDICGLHGSRPADLAEWLLCLLAALNEIGRSVTASRLGAGVIELTIDGARCVIGQTELTCHAAHDHFRPDMPGALHKAGLLGHYLTRQGSVCRLRIDRGADSEVTRDLCSLFLRLHSSKAVIVNPDRLVLTITEFNAVTPQELPRLRRGARIVPLSQRFARANAAGIARPPCANAIAARASWVFTSNRARTGVNAQATRSTFAAAPGEGGLVATAYCRARTEHRLKSAFRAERATFAVQMQACDTSAVTAQVAANAEDALICDAIHLSARGKTLRLVAPLLMATMVLLTNLQPAGAGENQRQFIGVLATGDLVAPATLAHPA